MRKNKSAARSVALIGVMAAIVECAKLALAAIPNVEAVTLLLALFGYTFGWHGVAAAYVFVCIEPLIYGFNTWFITYLLYWPLVAFVFMLFGRSGIKRRLPLTVTAVFLTVLFGVLSSLVDVGLFTGYFDKFWYRFGIYYARGIPFYITQILCNAALFISVFPSFSRKLKELKI